MSGNSKEKLLCYILEACLGNPAYGSVAFGSTGACVLMLHASHDIICLQSTLWKQCRASVPH